MASKERWLPVVGFGGKYEVSDFGRVRSRHNGVLHIKKPSPQTGGYYCVWLQNGGRHTVKNKLVSRLVLEAFVGPAPTEEHEAAHNDGQKANNALTNLRWATHAENEKDKEAHGTRVRKVGVAVNRGVLNHISVERIRDMRAAGCTHRQISEWVGTCLSNVAYVLQGRTWSHV